MSETNGKLLPHQLDYLHVRGVSDDTIHAHGIFSEADPERQRELLGWDRPPKRLGPLLCFPSPDGDPTDYVVCRPLHPRQKKKPDGKIKAIKFENPRGKPLRAYIPPTVRAALSDLVRPPVFITEGVPKALAAVERGFPCISLPGVWGWCQKRPKRNGKGYGPFKLNETLAGIDWKGRLVYVVFDSDAVTNSDVRLAEWKLAELLCELGANVRVIRLPAEPDGSKNGLDDFLVRRGADDFRLLVETAQPPTEPDRKKGAAGKKEKVPSAADVLAGIGMSVEPWHDATSTAYATIGRHSHPVRSKAFRQWLVNQYRQQTGGKVPNAEAIGNALNVIEAAGVFDGPERPAFVRVGGFGDRTYFHLADADGTVIEIGPDGWQVCPNPPVRFRKPSGMLALPMPQRGGTIEDLRKFLNVPDDDTFALVKAGATSAFRPDGPFPLLVLMGEQGSAKTTTARVLKKLIDPSAAPDRGTPRDERDAMIRCRSNWLIPYDNLSGLSDWLSDAFCRLATGGGFGTRELYSNDDEIIFDAKRPLILNGIAEFVERADLLERSLLIRHPPIPEEKRRPESEFWAQFDAAHPKLLGALLDRVAAGLRELPSVKLAKLPRMADFALFAVACEKGAGECERFQAAYAENQAGAREQALDISPVPAVLVAMLEAVNEWQGTASKLLEELVARLPKNKAGTPEYPQDWPKKPASLTNTLQRLAPDLRRVHGLNIESGRQPGGKRARFTRITRLTTSEGTPPESGCKDSSRSSPPSRDGAEDVNSQEETSPPVSSPWVVPASSPSGNGSSRPPAGRPGVVPPESAKTPTETQPRDDRDDRDDPLHPLSEDSGEQAETEPPAEQLTLIWHPNPFSPDYRPGMLPD